MTLSVSSFLILKDPFIISSHLFLNLPTDVIYLNGWVSLFQFLINIPFAVPSAWLTGLKTSDIPQDMVDGSKCYWGINSYLTDTSYGPADDCHKAFLYTNAYLVSSLSELQACPVH